jgi:hypothetical protein
MSQIFPGNFLPPKVSVTEPFDMLGINGPILNATGTVTASFGSSLFLQRLFIPVQMNLSEIDLAVGMSFNASSNGAGTKSQSLGIYSFVNSSSLASVMSASGTSAWTSGTSTVGGSVSLTEFQGGWSGNVLQPMTFASSKLSAGEYVVGILMNFAQGTSTWTVNLYGQVGISSSSLAFVTGITSATLGALSSGGLAGVSAFTASASSALTVWTAAPSIASAMSSGGLSSASGLSGVSSYGSSFWAMQISPAVTASGLSGFSIFLGTSSGSIGSGVTATYLSFSGTGTVKSSATNWTLIGNSANSNIVSSLGTLSGSHFTSSASVSVLSNAGTAGVSLMASAALSAGSFIGTSGSLGAVTNVGLAALSSITLAATGALTFNFVGTGSTTSAFGNQFMAGIMSTGAMPANITLSSTNVTMQGGPMLQQPWFALVGA